jgi:pyridoxal phosphate enzyme (YggS family)
MHLAEIKNRIAQGVTLVAVSKSQPLEKIKQVLDAGQRVFGENRVQEAMEKWPALRAQYPGVVLHFIGRVQTNKLKDMVALFDVIETVDSEKTAAALKEEMTRQNKNLPCFLQVNTGEEPQKGGVAPRDLEKLFRFCRDEAKLSVTGLMCIPPAEDLPALHFALLHKLGRELDLKNLSMGMSADFETAIRYGATHVRIGSALFGERK